jgi:hypothetical protein
MPSDKNISSSRRRFLSNGLKATVLSSLLLPLQKAFGNGTAFIAKTNRSLRKPVFLDKLVLNTKTKVVHLPTNKIFNRYPDIADTNQKLIDLGTWETQVKAPIHFNKEKSGIIIELLALQKLNTGINDKSLTAAINTLSIAFMPVYKDKNENLINKYGFRLHDLLLQTIALNNTIPVTQKWARFQAATGRINYTVKDLKPISSRMKWIKTKTDFDKQAEYILNNKTTYINRLKQRATDYKL